MFSQIDKYCLWNLMNDSIKINDAETTQFSYEGENRGQTQRFDITAGDMLEDLFELIESSFYSQDGSVTSFSMLQYLQRAFNATFVEYDVAYEDTIREVLEEIFYAWRFKGTRAFLHWVIWKAFGWQLLEMYSVANMALLLNVSTSRLYASTATPADLRVLYDHSLLGSEVFNLVIDVFSDVDYLDKKATLERLIEEWTLPCDFVYRNTP